MTETKGYSLTDVPLARRRKKQVQTKIAQNIYEKAESIWNN